MNVSFNSFVHFVHFIGFCHNTFRRCGTVRELCAAIHALRVHLNTVENGLAINKRGLLIELPKSHGALFACCSRRNIVASEEFAA